MFQIPQKQPNLLHISASAHPNLDPEEQQQAAKRFVEVYSAGGKTICLYAQDVGFDWWYKFVFNASFNPICALTGLNASELLLTAAAAAGHDISPDVIEENIQLNPTVENIKPTFETIIYFGNRTFGSLICRSRAHIEVALLE
ncbi:hypothetical protein CORC01_07640 [Colletotrichum orchidophilum]|uniref:Ketopantoate reductase C-terminal domain-containing protein n=1 Tax=Colletotrichum orchidophilum TaxID=1209926 RepID=A0A1G4B6J2_9PEZI|nr:uncharacterized protein CORC01_07640 [Colletotrichum orchidophilum]OHE97031.1 hypothetical protein CORC01_07640 [Colletotrichum orchidophilum]